MADHWNTQIWPHHTSPAGFALASGSPADNIEDRDAGQQVSAGPSTPVCGWALPTGGLSLLDVSIWGRLPPANWVCNGQPQPSVAGTLLFPVQTFGTAYQPTCVFRHCRRQLLHDTWRHTLNDIYMQRLWVFLKAALFISDFINNNNNNLHRYAALWRIKASSISTFPAKETPPIKSQQ